MLRTPRYLYHGTMFARLKAIYRDGLKPGEVPIWRDDAELTQRCSEAVFFADYWRGAAFFAEIAYYRSRGRREGLGRRPVIIRISASEHVASQRLLTI
ncbi:hypothetical protein [Microvirga roseola]|uniref:hypothetical protein n=1 Tax=Microvirga roseola TaxID=2883126 RepID=UPI001E65D09B|nr:hypothetical protein [Microvirga roseola]